MFSLNFWKKYIFRVLKLLSIMLLCHQVISFKFTNKPFKQLQTWYLAASIICIISGTANIFIYNPNLMGPNKQKWLILNYFKLFITILAFTPIIKILPFSKKGKTEFQFYTMLLFMILSPFVRYYREVYTKRERQSFKITERSSE